ARFPGANNRTPEVWSEAVQNRVANQKPKADVRVNPFGFMDAPRKTDSCGGGGGYAHPFFDKYAAPASETLTTLFNIFTAQRSSISRRKKR
ncbi:unnamed protein product, partial [Didymodactylos carnosus]